MTNVAELRLVDDVDLASQIVPPQWPLSGAIAVNPLQGFEHLGVREARDRAEGLFASRGLLTLADFRAAHAQGRVTTAQLRAALVRATNGATDLDIDLLLTDLIDGVEDPDPQRWSTTIAEQVDAASGTDHRAMIDHTMAERCARGDLEAPEQPALAMLAAFDELRVPPYAQRTYLEAHVAAMPGWFGHLRWRQDHEGGTPVLEYLAARVVLEAQLVGTSGWYQADGPRPRPSSASLRERAEAVGRIRGASPDDIEDIARSLALLAGRDRALVWQDAYERSIHDPLLAELSDRKPIAAPDEIAAEVVCCIDVRSEGLRRHLEAVGPYDTHGYAGFFGLPVHIAPAGGGTGTDQLPVLLSPAATVTEHGGAARMQDRAATDAAWTAAKYHPVAPLALAEGAGWLAGPLAAARTLAPRAAARLADRLTPAPTTTTFDRSSISVAQQADWVTGMLQLGVGAGSAPLVVLCGHEARADNNPFESALACGACAGHSGAGNARLAAAMANDPEVRAELAQRGTPVGADTWFVAAVHETVADRVSVLDAHLVPASHQDHLTAVAADLTAAGEASATERARQLEPDDHDGDQRVLAKVRRRGRDWAEPLAELGLSGNMCFIAAPRSVTRELDLGRRAFLHTYDADADADGAALNGILTAPLVVAQWINAQYHHSTTDPEVFGAGTKAVHNVIGDIGVLSAAGGDLRRGLPLQSVRAGDRLLHEPVRLMAVVQGSTDHIDAAVTGSQTLRTLLEGEWISLVARADASQPWQQWHASGWADRELLGAPAPVAGTPRAVAG